MSTPTDPQARRPERVKPMRTLCPVCSRERPPITIHAEGCDICTLERQREADQAAFDAKKPAPVDGVITQRPSNEEIEAIRDAMLDRSMWSQMPDRRAKIGPQRAKAWDDYRTAVDNEAAAARAENRSPVWPEPPSKV